MMIVSQGAKVGRGCSRLAIAIAGLAGLSACSAAAQTSGGEARASTAINAAIPFPEVTPRPFENKQRRKWAHPVIADLDQDGRRDLLLIDHGFSVKLHWNLGNGRFSSGYDVIVGDTHGMAVADFDNDGLLEAIISRGGGSGTNARNALIFRFGRDRSVTRLPEREPPLRDMRGRTTKWIDSDNDGDLDLLLFGFPNNPPTAIGENDVYESDGRGGLLLHSRLPRSNNEAEHTLVTDFNGDGDLDLVRYGMQPMTFFQGTSGIAYADVSNSVFTGEISRVSGVVELDYDNDGDMDLYIARGEYPGNAETFYDADTQRLGFWFRRGINQLPDLELGENFRLRAYNAQYPHNRIWVGESAYEYAREGEWHSTTDIDIVSSEALGWPDELAKKGLYFGYVGNRQWRIALNVFPPTSGVVEGVTSFEESAHVEAQADLLLRNDGGRFTEVTQEAGLLGHEHTMSVAAGDFDNDGLIDLFLLRRGNMVRPVVQTIMINQGDGTFAALENHGVVSSELGALGMGAELVDFDDDGRIDILYGNDRGFWHLHRNDWLESARNHHVIAHIGASPSGRAGPTGALAQLTGCGITQSRRVGTSGAPYSQSFDTALHFGTGDCTAPHTLTVTWSNGETTSSQASPEG